MNRTLYSPVEGTPPKPGETASFVYFLRVGTLALSLVGLPCCAIFLPSVKKAAERAFEIFAPESTTTSVAAPRETEIARQDAENRANTLDAAPFDAFEPIVFADSTSARRSETFDAANDFAAANFDIPANRGAARDSIALVRATVPAVAATQDVDETAVRLQAELRARGVDGARVERWGTRFWRVSGRLPTNPETGLAEFYETIDVDPIVAAQTTLDRLREKIAAR